MESSAGDALWLRIPTWRLWACVPLSLLNGRGARGGKREEQMGTAPVCTGGHRCTSQDARPDRSKGHTVRPGHAPSSGRPGQFQSKARVCTMARLDAVWVQNLCAWSSPRHSFLTRAAHAYDITQRDKHQPPESGARIAPAPPTPLQLLQRKPAHRPHDGSNRRANK